MKKITLFLLLSLGAFVGYSQGDIKNVSYFTISWNRPIRSFGEDVDRPQSKNRFKTFKEDKDANHYGGALDFGAIFYIHPTGIIDGFKAGIMVDFLDLGANYFRYTDEKTKVEAIPGNPGNTVFVEDVTCNDLTARFSMNVGAIATFSPAKKFYIDIFGKLRPTFGVHYQKIIQYYDGTNYYPEKPNTIITWKQVQEDTGLGFGINTSFGLNLRYARFILGSEFVMGTLKLKYDDIRNDKKVYDQYLKVKLGFFFSDK
ncbi:MAG: hypothetical protein M0R02_07030 [Bacteroidales bacterium]|nr:hypothetical protein [Bacteroidales bacterium]NLK81714.1 hypothetical protein [Bacteroidales bacterium]